MFLEGGFIEALIGVIVGLGCVWLINLIIKHFDN